MTRDPLPPAAPPPAATPRHPLQFLGDGGVELAAESWGEASAAPVVLLHGGGQTRHAWKGMARALARHGYRAVAVDLRGHGDSGWSPDGRYAIEQFAADAQAVASALSVNGQRPVMVGASLGGIAALVAQALAQAAGRPLLHALVLVDVTPTLRRSGVERILDFMSAGREQGFASLEEAAEAVRAYLPHRRQPPSAAGLAKNLRRGPDGRWHWHWDPAFLDFARRGPPSDAAERLSRATAALSLPVLLVRGGRSEVVGDDEAAHFMRLLPSAEQVDIDDAAHMVAGDANDPFTGAIVEFLQRRLPGAAADPAHGEITSK